MYKATLSIVLIDRLISSTHSHIVVCVLREERCCKDRCKLCTYDLVRVFCMLYACCLLTSDITFVSIRRIGLQPHRGSLDHFHFWNCAFG